MDILERKTMGHLNPQLINFIKQLILTNESDISLVGSASLLSNRYFSDYDFHSHLNEKPKLYKIFRKIHAILKYFNDNENIYFIELKLQTKDGSKLKYNRKDKINFKEFQDFYENIIEIKLDFIVFLNSIFTDVSINYKFPEPESESESDSDSSSIIKELKSSIKELESDKKYYKALKRKFSVLALDNTEGKNANDLIKLTKFFNSGYGLLYSKKANLDTIESLMEYYRDPRTREKVIFNLKDIGLRKAKIKDIPELIEKYSYILNDVAKPLNDTIKIN